MKGKTKEKKPKKLYTAEYVIQDCPVLGRIVVKHHLDKGKYENYSK